MWFEHQRSEVHHGSHTVDGDGENGKNHHHYGENRVPEIVVEKPKHRAKQLEKVQRVHNLLLKDVFEIRQWKIKEVRAEFSVALVVRTCDLVLVVLQVRIRQVGLLTLRGNEIIGFTLWNCILSKLNS